MRKNGSWTILKSKTAYKNRWVKVVEDSVIQPDGKKGKYTVTHIEEGVTVLALEKNNVYLIRNFFYAQEKFGYELPTGAIDKGETPLQAAKRELKEETGIKAKKWEKLGTFDGYASKVKGRVHLYVATGLTFGEQALEGTEEITVKKLPFKEAVELVMKDKVVQGQSAFLLLKGWFLRKHL